MSERRVVITGMGVVSPLGNDLNTTWRSLIEGKSGIAKLRAFDASTYPSQIAGEVKNLNPEQAIEAKALKRLDRFSIFALVAAQEALTQAGYSTIKYYPSRMGCILGVGIGGLKTLEDNHQSLLEGGCRKVSPFVIPGMISNLAPGNVAIEHNLQGINFTVTSACTSGTHALGEAARLIKLGAQDLMVTGGTEAAITPLALAGFGKMKALSTRNDDPEKASRPFDKDRDGFVIGEGAAILILEEYEAARKRGANIHAEIVGYGYSCDAFHITAPSEDGKGATSCMRMALAEAKVPLEEVRYINAHGTSTPINDIAESAAIKTVFGSLAYSGLMVSSTKSMTGHLLGAAGGLEAAFSVMALKTGIIPPTINLDNPEPGCDLDYVPHVAKEVSINTAMSNSFGFGGTNASVVLRKI